MNNSPESWYAVKIYAEKASIMKYLNAHQIRTFAPTLNGKPLLGSISFIRCSESAVLKTKADWYSQMMVYRDASRERPQAIPDAEMENFMKVISLQGQEIIHLEIYDRKFLQGQKVKVIDGPLKGAVGIIKRVKGDRRLIVSVSGITAIATCFVHPDMLEPLDDQNEGQ